MPITEFSIADKVRDIDSLSEWWVLTLYPDLDSIVCMTTDESRSTRKTFQTAPIRDTTITSSYSCLESRKRVNSFSVTMPIPFVYKIGNNRVSDSTRFWFLKLYGMLSMQVKE